MPVTATSLDAEEEEEVGAEEREPEEREVASTFEGSFAALSGVKPALTHVRDNSSIGWDIL